MKLYVNMLYIYKHVLKYTQGNMAIFNCTNGCCTVKIEQYIPDPSKGFSNGNKAGAFIRDPKTKRVLLVQSRGSRWGCPKGGIREDETEKECAIREVMEETGLDISEHISDAYVNIMDVSTYFYVEMSEQEVFVQSHRENNDANGIAWLHPDCLEDSMKAGKMRLSSHAKMVFGEILKRQLVNYNEIHKGRGRGDRGGYRGGDRGGYRGSSRGRGRGYKPRFNEYNKY